MESFGNRLESLQAIAQDIASQEQSIPIHDVEELMREHKIWWNIGASAVKNGLDVSVRHTKLPHEITDAIDLNRYKTSDEFMGLKEDRLTLVARTATTPKHITSTSAASLFAVEHEIEVIGSDQNVHLDKPAPQPLSKHRPLKVSTEQKDTLELITLPKRVMAAKLGITRAMVSSRMSQIQRINQLNTRQVVLLALRDGLISTDELPDTTPFDLNERQQELIRDFAFTSRRETGRHYGLSEGQVAREWQLIHAQLHTKTECEAFALAYRDTLVTIDQ